MILNTALTIHILMRLSYLQVPRAQHRHSIDTTP